MMLPPALPARSELRAGEQQALQVIFEVDQRAKEYAGESSSRGEVWRKADVWRWLALDKEAADLKVTLADHHLLDDSTDSFLARLTRRGYILSKRTPVRGRFVRLTPKGRKLIRAVRTLHVSADDALEAV